MKRNSIQVLVLLFLLIVSYTRTNECSNAIYTFNNYNINILSIDRLPYNSKYVRKINSIKKVDEKGVPVHEYKGRNYYHPVGIALMGLGLLNSYRLTKDPIYLKQVDLYIQKLVEESIEYNNAIYYPYKYDFPLHKIKHDLMKAPWFSAMAQGQILSMLVRMYEFTDNPKYLKYARKTYNSFLNFKYKNEKWVSFIDKDSSLWFEEYPMDKPNFTLNGTIFAIYGVYDFYRINQDDIQIKEILMASITTIQRNIEKFRHVGGYSYYCLKHKCQYFAYHRIHICQLKKLAEISGENYFNEIAEKFIKDAPPQKKEGESIKIVEN